MVSSTLTFCKPKEHKLWGYITNMQWSSTKRIIMNARVVLHCCTPALVSNSSTSLCLSFQRVSPFYLIVPLTSIHHNYFIGSPEYQCCQLFRVCCCFPVLFPTQYCTGYSAYKKSVSTLCFFFFLVLFHCTYISVPVGIGNYLINTSFIQRNYSVNHRV